eukprot:3759917-Rhodomonas_salina.2
MAVKCKLAREGRMTLAQSMFCLFEGRQADGPRFKLPFEHHFQVRTFYSPAREPTCPVNNIDANHHHHHHQHHNSNSNSNNGNKTAAATTITEKGAVG